MDLFEHAEDDAALAEGLARSGSSLAKLLDPSYMPEGGRRRRGATNIADYYQDSAFECDPRLPLRDPIEEQFCQLMLDSEKPNQAYMGSFSSRCSVKSAGEQASKKLKVPRIKERLNYLRRQKWARQKAEILGEETGEEEGKKAKHLSIQEKLKILEKVIRDPSLPASDRVRALESHNKLLQAADGGEGKKKITEMDPVDVMAYFREAAEQGVDVRLAGQKAPDQGETRVAEANEPGAAGASVEAKTPQPVGVSL